MRLLCTRLTNTWVAKKKKKRGQTRRHQRKKQNVYIYNKILAAVGVENEMKVRLLHAVAVSS